MERLRVGEQIAWNEWGQIVSIVRMRMPRETHFEILSCFQTGAYASIKRQLDTNVMYYEVVHFVDEKVPPQSKVHVGEKEMSRMTGHIDVISPVYKNAFYPVPEEAQKSGLKAAKKAFANFAGLDEKNEKVEKGAMTVMACLVKGGRSGPSDEQMERAGRISGMEGEAPKAFAAAAAAIRA